MVNNQEWPGHCLIRKNPGSSWSSGGPPSAKAVVQGVIQDGKSKQHVWGYLSCVGTDVELGAMAFY